MRGILKRNFKKKHNYYIFSTYVENSRGCIEGHNLEGFFTLRFKLKDWEDFQEFKREYVEQMREQYGLKKDIQIAITGITYLGEKR